MSIKATSILRSAALLSVAVAALAMAPVARAVDEGFSPRPDFPGAKQEPEGLSAAQLSALTDARINITKAALQLTPDQEKYWPAVEDAIRTRAKNRQARIANVAARIAELRGRDPVEVLRDRNTVEFLQRRADALAQRSADLKRLADAWQPLYQTLSPDQKRRMAQLTVFTIREMRNAMEERRLESEYDDED
jgi:hypothetical protein